MDYEKIVLDALKGGLCDAAKKVFTEYQSPGMKMVSEAVTKNAQMLNDLVAEAMVEAVKDPAFRTEFKAAMRTTLAKQLVQKFGGELEKTVNRLKSDPITRAKITAALDEIITSKEPCAAS